MATKTSKKDFFGTPKGKAVAVVGSLSSLAALLIAYQHFNAPANTSLPFNTYTPGSTEETPSNAFTLPADQTRILQTRLNAFGNYGLTIDGKYGPATSQAVRALQIGLNLLGANLTADGQFGPATLTAAAKYSPAIFLNSTVPVLPVPTATTSLLAADILKVRKAIYSNPEARDPTPRLNIDESAVNAVLLGKDETYLRAFKSAYIQKYGTNALNRDLALDFGGDFTVYLAKFNTFAGLGGLRDLMAIRDTFVDDGKGHRIPVTYGTIIGEEASRTATVVKLVTINGSIVYAPAADLNTY